MPKTDYPEEIREAIEWYVEAENAFLREKGAYEYEKSKQILKNPELSPNIAECQSGIALDESGLAKRVHDADAERVRRACWVGYLQRRRQ